MRCQGDVRQEENAPPRQVEQQAVGTIAKGGKSPLAFRQEEEDDKELGGK